MILTIISIVLFIIVFIIVHEFGHFFAAKLFKVPVKEFGIFYPPRLWGKKIGETLYSINAVPLGGFVRIVGEDMEMGEDEPEKKEGQGTSLGFSHLAAYKRVIILASGVLMNFVFAWLVLSVVFMVGIPAGIVITSVEPNSPAEIGGAKVNDVIVGARSTEGELSGEIDPETFVDFINKHAGQEVVLKVERGSDMVELKTNPRAHPPAGEGALGVSLAEMGLPQKGLFDALWSGLVTATRILGFIYKALFDLITQAFVSGGGGLRGVVNSLGGPVLIFTFGYQAGSMGFVYLLQFFVSISLSLVALNILPFPPLDGGHILFILVEKIKGSPLSPKIRFRISKYGMMALVGLMIIVTIKDILGHV